MVETFLVLKCIPVAAGEPRFPSWSHRMAWFSSPAGPCVASWAAAGQSWLFSYRDRLSPGNQGARSQRRIPSYLLGVGGPSQCACAPSFDLQHLDLLKPWRRLLVWVVGIQGMRLWPDHLADFLNFMRKGKWAPPGAAAGETSRKTPGLHMSKWDGLSLIWAPVPSNSGTLTAQVPYPLRPSESLCVKRVQCEYLILRVKWCIWRAWRLAWHIASFHIYDTWVSSSGGANTVFCDQDQQVSKANPNPYRSPAVPHGLLFISTSLISLRFFFNCHPHPCNSNSTVIQYIHLLSMALCKAKKHSDIQAFSPLMRKFSEQRWNLICIFYSFCLPRGKWA